MSKQKKSSPYKKITIYGEEIEKSKCIGFCHCERHPGYLNNELCAKKECIENNCKYYEPIVREKEIRENEFALELQRSYENRRQKAEALAKELTKQNEFMHIIKVELAEDYSCEIKYTTDFSSYDNLDDIAKTIGEEIGAAVKFKNISAK